MATASSSSYEAVCTFHGEHLAKVSARSKNVARQLAAQAGLTRLAEEDLTSRCACKAERRESGAASAPAGEQELAVDYEDDMKVDCIAVHTIAPDAEDLSDAMSD